MASRVKNRHEAKKMRVDKEEEWAKKLVDGYMIVSSENEVGKVKKMRR